MSWMEQIGSILQQYAGASPHQAPSSAPDDFDQVTRSAPPSAIADGIAAAFRSDQTPPFAQMVAQLFRQSDSQQRAGLLNTLLSAVGPALASQVLGQSGASGLAGLLQGGQTQVTPQQANQVSPEVVEQIAAQAESQDRSVIDRLGDFYAQHPTLVKALGTATVTLALSQLAQRHQGR